MPTAMMMDEADAKHTSCTSGVHGGTQCSPDHVTVVLRRTCMPELSLLSCFWGVSELGTVT